MGALYDIEVFLDCKNTDEVVRLAKEYAASAKKWAVISPFDNFDEMLKAFLRRICSGFQRLIWMGNRNARYVRVDRTGIK